MWEIVNKESSSTSSYTANNNRVCAVILKIQLRDVSGAAPPELVTWLYFSKKLVTYFTSNLRKKLKPETKYTCTLYLLESTLLVESFDMSSAPEWVGESDVLEDLWAEACGYDIPPGLLKKESTTRTFVETKKKAHGKTSIICYHSLFFTLFLNFPVYCHLVFSHVFVSLSSFNFFRCPGSCSHWWVFE